MQLGCLCRFLFVSKVGLVAALFLVWVSLILFVLVFGLARVFFVSVCTFEMTEAIRHDLPVLGSTWVL